jgi:integrase
VLGAHDVREPAVGRGDRTTAARTLAPLLKAHMDEYAAPGDGGLVFPAVKVGPLRRSYFNRLVGWKAAVDAIGVPGPHFHDLRHTGDHLAAQSAGHDRPRPYPADGPRQ